jgi:hypothetical protein
LNEEPSNWSSLGQRAGRPEAPRRSCTVTGSPPGTGVDNDALEDVDGVDLVFDVFGGDIGKRSAGVAAATQASLQDLVELRCRYSTKSWLTTRLN